MFRLPSAQRCHAGDTVDETPFRVLRPANIILAVLQCKEIDGLFGSLVHLFLRQNTLAMDTPLAMPQELVVLLDKNAISSLMLVCKNFNTSISQMSACVSRQLTAYTSTEFWLQLASNILCQDVAEVVAKLAVDVNDALVDTLKLVVLVGPQKAIETNQLALRILWECRPTKLIVFEYLQAGRMLTTLTETLGCKINTPFGSYEKIALGGITEDTTDLYFECVHLVLFGAELLMKKQLE